MSARRAVAIVGSATMKIRDAKPVMNWPIIALARRRRSVAGRFVVIEPRHYTLAEAAEDRGRPPSWRRVTTVVPTRSVLRGPGVPGPDVRDKPCCGGLTIQGAMRDHAALARRMPLWQRDDPSQGRDRTSVPAPG